MKQLNVARYGNDRLDINWYNLAVDGTIMNQEGVVHANQAEERDNEQKVIREATSIPSAEKQLFEKIKAEAVTALKQSYPTATGVNVHEINFYPYPSLEGESTPVLNIRALITGIYGLSEEHSFEYGNGISKLTWDALLAWEKGI